MIDPKRVLRALAEHWTLLEPLCEHFDTGTLSLIDLRKQLAAQLPEGTPTDITALLGVRVAVEVMGSLVAHGKMGSHKGIIDKPVSF